jgi:putative acetyltransferase
MNDIAVATIRPEVPLDFGAIRGLLTNAFGGPTEATLVDRLRRDGELVLALVADVAGTVVGHVAFPRLQIEADGIVHPAAGLAPLAVAGRHRRHGIAAALARVGLERLAERGEALVFVLGDPAYYTRFGFSVETAMPYTCVYAGPHFMALRLARDAPRAGTVRYPAAFDDLR